MSAGPFHLEEVLPDAAVGLRRHHRGTPGTSPQGLAITLLADYTLATHAWFPAPALIALLLESGVGEAAARTAVSRLCRRGALETRRRGRSALYRLAIPAIQALSIGGQEIAAFPTVCESWEGHWTLIAFSVPQSGDTERHALRSRLRWMGYAPLYDGLWVSPHPLGDKAAVALTGFATTAITVFRASQSDLGTAPGRNPLDAWNLDSIDQRYREFVERWQPLAGPPDPAGTRTPTALEGGAAVRARTQIMDAFRQFVTMDPRLPMEAMPSGWLRHTAHSIFSTIYDSLARTAEDHVRGLACQHLDQPPSDIRAHTTADLRAAVFPTPTP